MKERSFKRSDLEDLEAVLKDAKAEAKRIWESFSSNTTGRTEEMVIENTIQGKFAEHWLVQTVKQWKLSTNKHYDIIDQDGKLIEVKAFTRIYDEFSKKVIREITKYETGSKTWSKADRMIFFRYEPEDENYVYVHTHPIKRNQK